MTESFDIIVIGGGIAGLSAAAELAADARVAVIEAETQPGYHSTGRSAAILAQNYGNGLIRQLTSVSLRFFECPPPWVDGPLLHPRGLLRIARPDQEARLRAVFDDMARDVALTWLTGDAVEALVPLLRPGHVAAAFRNPAAADIDVHGMMQAYIRRLRVHGGSFLGGAAVEGLARCGSLWRVATDSAEYAAPVVVNAAGAWADRIARLAGAETVGLTPLRRTAVTFDPPEDIHIGTMPMVVDADEAFYIKPEAGRLMASPADETPCPPGDVQPDELDVAYAIDRVQKAFRLDVRHVRSRWAGLRNFVADRSPVVGFDTERSGFFWLAGQGGYGVQTAPALARATADTILGRPQNGDIPWSELAPLRAQEQRQEQGAMT